MVWQGNRYIDIPASQKIGNITHEREGTATVEMEFRHRSAGIFRWDTERWSTEGVVGKVEGAEMNISWPWASTYQVDVQWCSPKFQTFSSRLLQMSLVPTSIQVVVFFGRAAVHLPRHGTSGSSWLVARYGGGCLQRFGPFPVRRATWFRLPSGQLEPYGEKMNRKLVFFLGGDYPVVGKGAKELW